MLAKGRPFSFTNKQMILEVPFFQRGYVWEEDNWNDLLENLESEDSHFLGSILLKDIKVETGEIPKKLVIDGQQRLTTLSILLRALYDRIEPTIADPMIKGNLRLMMVNQLFSPKSFDDVDPAIKLIPSYLDKDCYSDVVKGKYSDTWMNKSENDHHIVQCYKYFRGRFDGQSDDIVKKLWELLTSNTPDDESCFILVVIDLGQNENEQLIFDTLNTAGIRLSCSDIVKNELFRRLEEAAKTESKHIKITDIYEEKWRKVFVENEEVDSFWKDTRQSGRMTKDNLELLLHSVAIIKGYFDPETDKLPNLAQKYKDTFKTMGYDSLLNFMDELKEYSVLFKDNFTVDPSKMYSYEDKLALLLLILNVSGITTMYPYILRELKDNPESCNATFEKMAAYVMWNAVCSIPTKNYNKECKQIMNGKTFEKLFAEKCETYGASLIDGLKDLTPRKNHIASLILFAIELKRRAAVEGKIENNSLQYALTLEHVMPRKWEENWSVSALPVYIDGEICQDDEIAKNTREKAIFEIGNMTLLKGRLNTSISNAAIDIKINGNGKKEGIKISDLKITSQDIVEYHTKAEKYGGVWDERIIAERTSALMKEFMEIWPDLRK